MGVAGVQSGGGAYGLFDTQERKKRETLPVENRPSGGPDTASVSDEAAARYQAMKNGGVKVEVRDAPARSSSLSANGANLFGMMLESLFLAELDEAHSGSNPADTGSADGEAAEAAPRSGPERSGGRNPFTDTEKVAALKKVMSDFAGGKADLSDLPKAMALGGSGASSPAAKTASSRNAFAHKEDGNGAW